MTSDDFPAMIYSGSGVFSSVKNTVCYKDIVNQHHQQSSQRHGSGFFQYKELAAYLLILFN